MFTIAVIRPFCRLCTALYQVVGSSYLRWWKTRNWRARKNLDQPLLPLLNKPKLLLSLTMGCRVWGSFLLKVIYMQSFTLAHRRTTVFQSNLAWDEHPYDRKDLLAMSDFSSKNIYPGQSANEWGVLYYTFDRFSLETLYFLHYIIP